MARQGSPRRANGEREAEVLAVLWAADGPLTPAQVQAALDDDLAYNTVHTILVRLLDKGQVVKVVQAGRPAYATAKDAAEDAADRMLAVLDGGVDRSTVLTRFVTALDPGDEEAIRAALRQLRRR
jgi:predicted transcriptional regulator